MALAGSLLSPLFEGLFKRHNSELKLVANRLLRKADKKKFDILKYFGSDIITTGLETAIQTLSY